MSESTLTDADGTVRFRGTIAGGDAQPGAARWVGPFPLYGEWWQGIAMDSGQDGGTFTLSYDGDSTAAIAWDANAAAVQSALETIPALTGKVTCTGTLAAAGVVYVVLDHTLEPPELLVGDGINLTPDGFAPGIGSANDPANLYPGITTVTLAAGDILEDVFVDRRAVFPTGCNARLRQDLDGTSSWVSPNAANWSLDQNEDTFEGQSVLTGNPSFFDFGYAVLLSDAERQRWAPDEEFYSQVPAVAASEVTIYVRLLGLGATPDSTVGEARFYLKVAIPAGP